MDTIASLQGRITARARAARHLLAEKGDQQWTKSDQVQFDSLMNDAERAESMLQILGAGTSASAKWARAMVDLDGFIRNGPQPGVKNTMSTTTGSQGGYSVDPLVAHDVISVLRGTGYVRQPATGVTTKSGVDMSWPTSDGTSEVGERLAQNASASALDPSFGSVLVSTYRYSSKIMTWPIELLQDTAIDAVKFVTQRGIERIAAQQNIDFTTGTGTGQPNGLVTASSVGKIGLTGQTTTIIYDDLADMVESVNPAALGMPSKQAGIPTQAGAGWMTSQTLAKVIRKIKDTAGRPIWMPGMAGEPPELLGYPLFYNADMPAPAANSKSLAFGALSKYLVRDVAEVSFMRFNDSVFNTKGQIGFLMFTRAGGNLLDTSAVKLYAHSAT